jgi:predicted MFS family arabinose efflux permease
MVDTHNTATADTAALNPPAEKTNRRAWCMLAMLTLAYVFNFVDRQILIVLQEPIKAEMGLSDVQLGLLSGFSFALVYVTAGIPIAYLADRTNRRNIIAVSMTIWSAMTALCGMAGNYSQLLLARIGVGIGEAGGTPPAHSMISDCFPPETRATALSIYSSGLQLGVVLGFVLGGTISQLYGWRVAFMLIGLPGVLFALVFLLTVREPRRNPPGNSSKDTNAASFRETIGSLLACRTFMRCALAAGLTAFASYGAGNFAPSFLMRNHGLSISEVGLLLALFGGGSGLLGTFLGGFIADRLGRRDRRWYLWLPAGSLLLSLPLSLPYLMAENLTVVITFMALTTLMVNMYIGPVFAVSHSLVPPNMRATASAVLMFIVNMIGMGLGPVAVGLCSDLLQPIVGQDSLRYAMLAVMILASPAVLLYLLSSRSYDDDYRS